MGNNPSAHPVDTQCNHTVKRANSEMRWGEPATLIIMEEPTLSTWLWYFVCRVT